jgi:hypothetical protein
MPQFVGLLKRMKTVGSYAGRSFGGSCGAESRRRRRSLSGGAAMIIAVEIVAVPFHT